MAVNRRRLQNGSSSTATAVIVLHLAPAPETFASHSGGSQRNRRVIGRRSRCFFRPASLAAITGHGLPLRGHIKRRVAVPLASPMSAIPTHARRNSSDGRAGPNCGRGRKVRRKEAIGVTGPTAILAVSRRITMTNFLSLEGGVATAGRRLRAFRQKAIAAIEATTIVKADAAPTVGHRSRGGSAHQVPFARVAASLRRTPTLPVLLPIPVRLRRLALTAAFPARLRIRLAAEGCDALCLTEISGRVTPDLKRGQGGNSRQICGDAAITPSGN